MGALPGNGILETHSTRLCVALFNAAHSLYSLNRCLETGSCLFWMSTKCHHTAHPFLPLCPQMPVPGFIALLTCLFYIYAYIFIFFCLPPSHCLTLHSPHPWPSSGFGVWNAQSMQYSWTQMFLFFFSSSKYCIVCSSSFFSFVCVYIFFPPPFGFNLFVNM